MELHIKHYSELSPDEVYDILKLRTQVFIVEQSCPYQDADGLDREAVHMWLSDESGLTAYLRIMKKDAETAAIGRVIAVKRRQGLASRLLREAISTAAETFAAKAIYLEAQVYAKELYEKLGFSQISEEFLEDGIPHIKMLLELK